MPRVAIIGGGITGLTAGYLLGRHGVSVSVHDDQDRPGGVIRSTVSGGFLAEHGPNSIQLTSPAVMELVRELGLDGRVRTPGASAPNRYIVRRRRPVRVPRTPGEFIRTPLFSARAKLRLLGEPFVGRASADADESLGQFVRRRAGREFLEYAADPFAAGVYAGDPERLSVRHGAPSLHALEQRYGSLLRGAIVAARREGASGRRDGGLISFDGGLQVLTDALAARLGGDLHQGRSVAALRPAPSGWTVIPEDPHPAGDPGRSRPEQTTADAVLYAGSAHGLAALGIGGNGRGGELAELGAIRYPPVSSLVLGFRRDRVGHALDGFGVLVPEAEPFAILGALFSSSLFPGRAPERHVAITCFLGGTRRPETASGETGELVETALRDLRSLLDVRGEPVFVHRAFYPRAIPQYDVGYGRHLEAMDRAELLHPGLFIAGNFRDGVSIGSAITSGHAAAGRIRRFLAAGG